MRAAGRLGFHLGFWFPAALAGCGNDIQVADKPNVPPSVVINSPADGSVFIESEAVEFLGTVADDELDTIGPVTWTSTLDGELGDPDATAPDNSGLSHLTTLLSLGMHAITLRATDADGEVAEASIDVVVGAANVDPTTLIENPLDGALVMLGDEVSMAGTVADEQDAPTTLTVEWVFSERQSGDPIATVGATATPAGLVQGTWTASVIGDIRVELVATDPDGHVGTSYVTFEVGDPGLQDSDGDGYTPQGGDCDDTDPDISPGAPEVCPDEIDNDCNLVVDDKDLDHDNHLDEGCITYQGGLLPIDDCDDDQANTYPGAPEGIDGLDNDCDGYQDDGTVAFDDDGDCFCETGPCADTIATGCGTLLGGDCDDDDDLIFPGGVDTPDPGYLDGNCDDIDGDVADSVFVDNVNGLDTNDGLTPANPLRILKDGIDAAVTSGRGWVLIAPGSYGFAAPTANFVEGISLAGGYDVTFESRDPLEVPEITVTAAGKTLSDWTQPTEWHQIHLHANGTGAAGESSIALTLDSSDGLLLVDCEIEAGNAGDGTAGSAGSTGGTGNDGGDGESGCIDGNGLCGTCARPTVGISGTACTGANKGGAGGTPEKGKLNGNKGANGVGTGFGTGGNGGTGNGANGIDGLDGADGAVGANGSPGNAIGTFNPSGYTPSNGGVGATGATGAGGGGGGGGAGGGWDDTICDTYGGAGGGGGGGGCGGTGAGGGTGGGASAAILMTGNSSLTIVGGTVLTGRGGDGGNGGTGGNGGVGGDPGSPGNGAAWYGQEKSGDGGAGAPGGSGGRGGHGGGGGGGPSVGVVCRGGSTLDDSGPTYTIGAGGAGGAGPGSPGADGLSTNTDGC